MHIRPRLVNTYTQKLKTTRAYKNSRPHLEHFSLTDTTRTFAIHFPPSYLPSLPSPFLLGILLWIPSSPKLSIVYSGRGLDIPNKLPLVLSFPQSLRPTAIHYENVQNEVYQTKTDR